MAKSVVVVVAIVVVVVAIAMIVANARRMVMHLLQWQQVHLQVLL
jgi:hypothetical protein